MGVFYKNKYIVVLALLLLVCSVSVGYVYYFLHKGNSKEQNIKKINANIVIYSKSACMYCILAKQFLDDKKVSYEVVELTNNRDLFIKLSNQTGQNTVPYIFIDDKFIGGYQDLLKYNLDAIIHSKF